MAATLATIVLPRVTRRGKAGNDYRLRWEALAAFHGQEPAAMTEEHARRIIGALRLFAPVPSPDLEGEPEALNQLEEMVSTIHRRSGSTWRGLPRAGWAADPAPSPPPVSQAIRRMTTTGRVCARDSRGPGRWIFGPETHSSRLTGACTSSVESGLQPPCRRRAVTAIGGSRIPGIEEPRAHS
jgi:hypothetical protein